MIRKNSNNVKVDISVIILSWNDWKHLEECLKSLSNRAQSRTVEIIVVDNASTDGSPENVEALFPNVRLIKNKENLGFARGNNMGVKAGQGKYVCLLNSDIKVGNGCLEVLANYLDQYPDIGIIGPRILNDDMTHQSSCRAFPNLWNNFCSATGMAGAFRRSKLFSGEHMFYFKGDRILDVDVLVGCFWMARREAINEFGLLDEGFFMYAEDVDWCKRCRNAGWRVVFFPQAQAIHYRGGSSTKQDPVWVAVTQQRSILRYWRKHHGAFGCFNVACLICIHKIIRLAAASIGRLVQPSRRKENGIRIRVFRACLRSLFSKNRIECA